VRILNSSGFVVDGLHELYAPEGASDHSYYEIVSAEWSTRWPSEELWVATRR
jgi:hypothetical protein